MKMWNKKAISKLDKYFPPAGPCLFCGHKDKRHRLWDAILALYKGGETIKFIAEIYDLPIKAIQLVIEIKPYKK